MLPKFDFDASLDRALKSVMQHTEFKTEEAAMELALVITRRDAAVVCKAHCKPFDEGWKKASLEIAQCDALLAPHMPAASSRVGQVWAGVLRRGDVCLCVESSLSRGGQLRHRFLDLENGKERLKREADPFELTAGMQRLA